VALHDGRLRFGHDLSKVARRFAAENGAQVASEDWCRRT
jgi:hypothetical protein